MALNNGGFSGDTLVSLVDDSKVVILSSVHPSGRLLVSFVLLLKYKTVPDGYSTYIQSLYLY
jgi:hypothetical protein